MNQSGFSLIELVIVIAIMGLLGMAAVPSFSAIQNKTKNTSFKSTAHTIEMALETYVLDKGTYPSGQNVSSSALVETLMTAGLLTTVPINPFTGKAIAPCFCLFLGVDLFFVLSYLLELLAVPLFKGFQPVFRRVIGTNTKPR